MLCQQWCIFAGKFHRLRNVTRALTLLFLPTVSMWPPRTKGFLANLLLAAELVDQTVMKMSALEQRALCRHDSVVVPYSVIDPVYLFIGHVIVSITGNISSSNPWRQTSDVPNLQVMYILLLESLQKVKSQWDNPRSLLREVSTEAINFWALLAKITMKDAFKCLMAEIPLIQTKREGMSSEQDACTAKDSRLQGLLNWYCSASGHVLKPLIEKGLSLESGRVPTVDHAKGGVSHLLQGPFLSKRNCVV